MTAARLKQIWENDYFKTAITIILIVAIVFGFWYGSQLALNTQYPALAVASGSMCTLPGSCDGWSHPFESTLHIGDLIIIQGVNPEELKAAPHPDGDIIVFRPPQGSNDLIVHRAIEKQVIDGKIFFRTKGDGNPGPDSRMVSEDHIVGRVVLRIPWVGHIALFLRNSSGIFIILFLIVILVIVEFIIPVFKGKETETERKENLEKVFET